MATFRGAESKQKEYYFVVKSKKKKRKKKKHNDHEWMKADRLRNHKYQEYCQWVTDITRLLLLTLNKREEYQILKKSGDFKLL